MIRTFLVGGNYTHDDNMDVFLTVVNVEEREDYFKLQVLWKKRSSNKIIFDNYQDIHILKSSLVDWHLWPR